METGWQALIVSECATLESMRPERLSALRAVKIGARAEKDLGRLHHGFRERRVWMDGQLEIARPRSHLDGEDALGN